MIKLRHFSKTQFVIPQKLKQFPTDFSTLFAELAWKAKLKTIQ
jgi:hypothetical protein